MAGTRSRTVSVGKLTFSGRCIGRGSSRATHKRRWTEIDIYTCDDGGYVSVVRGVSTREAEQELVNAKPMPDAEALVDALFYNDRFSRPAHVAL